jgi:hypothetical protein
MRSKALLLGGLFFALFGGATVSVAIDTEVVQPDPVIHQEQLPLVGRLEVLAVGARTIVGKPLDPEMQEAMTPGRTLTTRDGQGFKVQSQKDGMIVLAHERGTRPAVGATIELFDAAEQGRAEEILRQFEPKPEEKVKVAIPKSPTFRDFMDLDYFLPPGRIALEQQNQIILKEGYSASASAGSGTLDSKEKGFTNSLRVTAGLFERLNVLGQFNYVGNRRTETTLNGGDRDVSRYNGVDNPEFGASLRMKDRLQDGDYSVSLNFSFQPSIIEPKVSPQGPTRPGNGYATMGFNVPFAWKVGDHEFAMAPQFMYFTSGGATGVEGESNRNIDSALVFAVGGVHQFQFSEGFRLRTLFALVFPHSREITFLTSPNIKLKTETPLSIVLNVAPQISLHKENRLIFEPSISGTIPTSKVDWTRTQGGASVSGKASTDMWHLGLGFKYLF